tara:strand:- start:882 stop:3491 length:2610 start_codon:yes stop_codon:yes gene_type:complete
MTIVSSKNTPRVAYTATANQQAFTIPFEFFAVGDIKVYNGTTLLTYDANADAVTEYSITGTASDSDDAYEFGAGGTVNIGATGIANGAIITIIRDITIERASDFSPSGTFDITALNTDLDKVYAKLADIDQQSDRSVKLLDTDSISATVTLPAKADRASKVMAFDSDGNLTTQENVNNVSIADESSDTTCFPTFVTAASGDLPLKSAAGLTFNASTDVLTGTFAGNITGNVTGNVSGSSGSCTGTAAVATAVTITDNESTNEDNALIFTSGGDVDGGNIGLESDGTCTYNPSTGKITATGFIGALTGNASGSSGSCTGNAATATALATARNIGGVSFDGTGNINLPGVNTSGNQDTSGTAADATVLETARNIGGVSFNGSANIDLPGVNSAGNQNTSGTAAGLSATLAVGSGGTGATSLTANGVLVGNGTSAVSAVDLSTKGKILIGDGSGNPSALAVGTNDHVLTADSGEGTGTKWAAIPAPTTMTIADESSDTTCFPLFVTAATGDLAPKSGTNLTFNSSSGLLTATAFSGALTGNVTGNASGSSGSCTGNAATATALATGRNIGGVSFDGTGNIDLPGVNSAGNQNTSGNAAGLSSTLAVGSGGTGATSLTANGVIIGNGTSALTAVDLSTKGKILVGDGSGNPSALAVGTNDHVLTADSSEGTGIKWAAVSAGGGGGGFNVESAVNFYGSGGSSVATYEYTGFDSDYDNYWVFIHGIGFDANGGNLDFRFLDDGSAVTDSGYRVAAAGQDSNGTARPIDENDASSASLTSLACNGSDAKPLTGWLYFPNGRGGRWDSDSTDSEGGVSPYMQFHLGYKNSSNFHEVVSGSVHQDNTQANAMNGFQLIATTQNFRKVCLTVYGIKRS